MNLVYTSLIVALCMYSLSEAVDDSWRDEVAQAACTAIQSGPGWMFAVRRKCPGLCSCASVCAAMASQDSQVISMACVDSFHVYPGTHPLESGLRAGDKEVLGTKVYRDFSCDRTDCGPNFCCCKGF